MPCIISEASFDRYLIIWALRAIYLRPVFFVHLDTSVLPVCAKVLTGNTMHKFRERVTLSHIAVLFTVVVE